MSDATLPMAEVDKAEALLRFSPGTSIGRFRITRKLGAGGMGTVYEAFDPDLERSVAIKVLADSADRRLMDEAQAMARLSHPNVVPIHEVGTVDGQLFLVMELVRGETLASWLAAPRSWRDIVTAFAEAGLGLAAAHRAGLVHRDFKPTNVLVDRMGHVRVSDFGLARADGFALGSDTRGEGTPGYMAPEQGDGRPIDARSDEYAFGISLAKAFVGTRIPRRVRSVIARATSIDPAGRYPSMDALLFELRRALTRKRRAVIAIAAISIAGITGAYLARPAKTADCDDGAALVREVWSPAMADATSKRLLAIRPNATVEIATMRRILDGWTESWQLGRRAACRVEPVERTSRVACLDEALGEARAQLSAWSSPDATAVDRVVVAAGSLPDPNHCVRPAKPASLRALPIQERTAKLVAAHRAGQFRSVVALVPALVTDARALGEPSVTSAALLAAGTIASDANDLDTARADMAEAVVAAGKANDDARLVEALQDEAAVTINLGRPVDGLGLLDAADAVTARSGASDDSRTMWLRGNAYLDAGKLSEAKHALERSIAILEPIALHEPARDLELAHAVNLLAVAYAQGFEVGKARPLFLRALAIRERELGPLHPDVGATLGDLAQLEAKANLADEADAHLERARALYVAAYGPDDLRVAQLMGQRGLLLAMRGNRAEGAAVTEQAIAIMQRTLPADDTELVSLEQQLGAVIGCSDKAIPHLERAAAILEHRHEIAETHGVIMEQLAMCENQLGRFELAYGFATNSVAELERAGAAPNQLAIARMTLADLLDHRGQRARAIELAQQVLDTTKAGDNDALDSVRDHEVAQLKVWKR